MNNKTMKSINVDGMERHIFCRPKSKKDKIIETTEIQLYDEACKNCINIIELLVTLVKTHYLLPEKMEFIEISSHDDYDIHKIIQNKKYMLFTYKKQESYIPLTTYLLHFNHNPTQFVFHLQHSYSHLLTLFKNLETSQLCYFGLSSKSILYHVEHHTPLLQCFTSAFQTKQPNTVENFIRNIQTIDNFSNQPLEIHMIYFLLKNEGLTLSHYHVEEIVDHYMRSMQVFSLFSDSYNQKVRYAGINLLNTYVNHPLEDIIKKVVKYADTWDNFALSVLYLYLVGNAIRIFKLKDTFFNGWVKILTQNLNPDPAQRENIENTQKKVERLYYDYPNWKFAKSISEEQLEKVIEFFI
jgi:uncharacterized protein Usg